MVHREAGKTILDLFRSGKEIDAAVRRAVREAVGASPASRAKTKTAKKKKAAGRTAAASSKRAAPRRKAA